VPDRDLLQTPRASFRWPVHPGTPVRVYWNLHAKRWSIQTYVKLPTGHRWKVAGWADTLTLDAPTFLVYEKGRQRVLATGVKNVHAYVLGAFRRASLPDGGLWDVQPLMPITYNPRTAGWFHPAGRPGTIVEGAEALYLTNPGGLASVQAHFVRTRLPHSSER